MIIYLVGISCVGKTTIGKLLADYLDYEFYDLDEQIEKYFERPIEHIQNDFLTTNGYREKTSIVLNKILIKNSHMVIASTASGLRDHYLRQYKTIQKTKEIISINLIDKAENILNRLTFYKRFNLRADYSIDIDGTPLEVVLKKITETLGVKKNISTENIV